MESLISVVIPAFNAEKTISKCIYSILNQTYSNVDVIVVNDGSTDSTEGIVQKIITEDNRVRLFTMPNQGVSHARNFGIDHAKGDYLTFVDSDDYIDKEMYETLIRLSKEHGAKIVHCSYKNVTETGEILSIVGNQGVTIIQNHDDALSCIIEGTLFIGGLCNKLYLRELLDEYRLDESIKINEDVLLNFQLFNLVEKSVYCDIPFYNYVSNQSSSTHTAASILKGEQAVYVSRKILSLSMNQVYQTKAEKRVAISLLGLYGSLLGEKKQNKKKMKSVMNELVVLNKRKLITRRNDIIRFYLFRYSPFFYMVAYSVYDKYRVKKLDPEQSI